mgnify:CR=1 FL=1
MEKVKVHNTSDVQTNNIGYNTVIWQFCVILKGAIIGNNCNINCMVFIENDVRIGDNVSINNNATIVSEGEGISIGNDTLIGTNVFIADSDFHNLDPDLRLSNVIKTEKVTIGNNVFIGSNVSILKGVDIGNNSVIAYGSVVTKSIPSNVIAGGIPCKVIKKL